MTAFDSDKIHSYPIVLKINEGDVKLARLPIFNWQCVSISELNPLEEINLFICGNNESTEIDLCEVTLANSHYLENNTFDHAIIWTAQISTYWGFLLSLHHNYEFGKILFLLQLDANEVEIIIVIRSSCFQIFQHPDGIKNLRFDNHFSQWVNNKPNKRLDSIKPIFQSLFTLKDNCVQYDVGHVKKKNIFDLYEYVKNYHNVAGETSIDLRHKYQHKYLLPSLRNYQAHAVHWMITREKESQYETDSCTSVHPVWDEILCHDGQKIYFNTYTGGLTKVKPLVNALPKGGILADEMGLGKTVEVLACVLNHQSQRKHLLQRAGDDDSDEHEIPAKKPHLSQACQAKTSMSGNVNNIPINYAANVESNISNGKQGENKFCGKQGNKETGQHEQNMKLVKNDIIDFMLSKLRRQCYGVLKKNIADSFLVYVCHDLLSRGNVTKDTLHKKCMEIIKGSTVDGLLNKICDTVMDEDEANPSASVFPNSPEVGMETKNQLPAAVSLSNCICLSDVNETIISKNSSPIIPVAQTKTKVIDIKGNVTNSTSVEAQRCNDTNTELHNKDMVTKCSCSTLRILQEYFRYKIGDINLFDVPVKCHCDSTGQEDLYSESDVEMYMPEQELLVDNSLSTLKEKYIFIEKSTEYISGKDNLFLLKCNSSGEDHVINKVNEDIDNSIDKTKLHKAISNGSYKYPHKKKQSYTKLQALKNVYNDHSLYYKLPSYETYFSDYFKKCFMCSDNLKNPDAIQKIKCKHCQNVMHLECAGYKQLKVKHYECATCAMKQMIDTHCTLIVCPDTLLEQWVDEVQNHVKQDTFKHMVYRGVKFHQFIHPEVLAEYDLIVTTFSTLRLDFNYVLADETVRTLRHEKKYCSLPCPLLALNFWRVCIDEAQMVENDGGTKLSQMALKISAVHRWCVTGTPLQRSVEDMYGLFLFLSVLPYCSKLWWKRGLIDLYQAGNHIPLFNITSKLMWRMSKADVEEQIGIPKQTEYVSLLTFSAVEHYFYEKQYELCKKRTEDYIQSKLSLIDTSVKVCDIDKQTLTFLLSPLLQLRQACCHPAVVRGSYLPMEKKDTTMDVILEKLIVCAKNECEDAQRKLMCSLNGLASVEILYFNYKKAVEIYQEAMLSWERNSHIRTDPLLKLHTLHNLYSIINHVNIDEFPSMDCKKVVTDREKIYYDYLAKMNHKVKMAEESLRALKAEMDSVIINVDLKSPWWLNVLLAGDEINREELMCKIVAEVEPVMGHQSSLHGKFKTLIQLRLVLHQKLDELEEQRKDVLEKITVISAYPEEYQVQESAECCLRPVPGSDAPICCYCSMDTVLKDYEKMLFSRGANTEEGKGTGFRSDTEVDKVLQVLYVHLRIYGLPSEISNQAKEHLQYIKLIKKEYECIRSLFSAYHQRVQGLDELSMCVMRMRYKLPGEPDVPNQNYIIQPGQLDVTKLSLESDKIIATNELKKKESQLLYLENLTQVQTKYDGFNPDTCPICVSQLGTEWSVFKCGHCFCLACVSELQKSASSRGSEVGFKCPYCRQFTRTDDVSFVVTKQKECEGFDSDIVIQGHFSTKIEAILRRVNWIQCKDPGSKILIFSKWLTVLQLLKSALVENDISHTFLQGSSSQFQKSLSAFKRSPDINVLLSLLSAGGKGLNIIEATHVILVEPALNPGDELQAVGRIHRIGQTKETYVHRFIITGTVEEKIYLLQKDKPKSMHDKDGGVSMTINDLVSLFL